MKRVRVPRYIGMAGIVLVLLVTVGSVVGQGPDDPEMAPPMGVEEAFTPLDPGPDGSGELNERADAEFILAQPPYTMNYQGYLTDSSGNPLDGTYSMSFQLYDNVSAGTVEWGPETHASVSVSNGIFQVALGTSVALRPDDFDEALFLAVAVNGTNVSPRQPLRAVPYAFGLVPGAEVQGDPSMTNYALQVDNTGVGSTDRGLYARGEEYGIYAEEVGLAGDVGIYSPDFVQAKGFKSNFPSYWWYDANGMETEDTLSTTGSFAIRNYYQGGVELDCSIAGSDYVVLPLRVPGVLMGQEVRVEGAQVYYRSTNSATYVDRSLVYKSTGAGSSAFEMIASDPTNRGSTSATSYAIPIIATSGYTLTFSSGSLLAMFDLQCGDASHDLFISGVRLRLGHTD